LICIFKHDDFEKKLFRIIIWCFFLDNRSAAPVLPYPALPNVMTASTDSLRLQPSVKQVKVLHAYDAVHDDELTIRPGKI